MMLVRGDVEAINLNTGERWERVSGNGGSRLESLGIPGLKPVSPEDLAEYERSMTEEGIPQILEDLAERQRLAVEARRRII
jgi:hypothetical protein